MKIIVSMMIQQTPSVACGDSSLKEGALRGREPFGGGAAQNVPFLKQLLIGVREDAPLPLLYAPKAPFAIARPSLVHRSQTFLYQLLHRRIWG